MSAAVIQLSGSACHGVSSHLLSSQEMASLPMTVKLGRKRPSARPQALRFAEYFSKTDMTVALPASTNRRSKAAKSIARMYRNDVKGCCVISGKGHGLGLWSANDTDSGGEVFATDEEIDQQYALVCGPGDNGCVITNVLDYMKVTGFLAGGKRYKLEGYVACDWTNKLETQVVQYLFGANTIGIRLPQAWTQNAVWDVTNSRIVGGHDVTPVDYDEKGVYVASWGRIYLITWAAWLSRKWLEEYYALLAPLWYGNDKLAPSGVDSSTLKIDLAKLAGGTIPPIDPTPIHTCPPGSHWDDAAGQCVPDAPVPPVPPPLLDPVFKLKFPVTLQPNDVVSIAKFRTKKLILLGDYGVFPLPASMTAEVEQSNCFAEE